MSQYLGKIWQFQEIRPSRKQVQYLNNKLMHTVSGEIKLYPADFTYNQTRFQNYLSLLFFWKKNGQSFIIYFHKKKGCIVKPCFFLFFTDILSFSDVYLLRLQSLQLHKTVLCNVLGKYTVVFGIYFHQNTSCEYSLELLQ